MPGRVLAFAALALSALVPACVDTRTHSHGLVVLVDTSGTYARELGEVGGMIGYVVGTLRPGDAVAVANIGSRSFSDEEIVAQATLDGRPSRANAQKLALARELEAMAGSVRRSRYTDIPGAMMLGSEYLRETGSPTRVMLVFSDLREELPEGAKRELRPDELEGVHLVAMNVKRLGSDSADPASYRTRLEHWRQRVEGAGGAGWQIVMDASKLTGVLEALRS